MKFSTDLNNKYRVLLTEVLPYELPLVMNNEGFYCNMQDSSLRKLLLDVFQGAAKPGAWTIPFDYDIRRVGGEKSRKLSIMHPITQLDCVEFYAKYDDYMLNLCSNSPFSIRYVDRKARCIFPYNNKNEDIEDAMERHVELAEDNIETLYRSYFSYKKYDLAYKFFESGDNLRLEQKYPYMMTLDIAGCFYHIYTHSVAWAVKGKTVAKDNIGRKTFENEFDLLMQHTNYDETNGIIVGPEISRIFAEIIMQAIDLSIMRKIKEKYAYRLGIDYEIRRYVDDSYIYALSQSVLDDISSIYQEQLAFYKLDINKSKKNVFERPFSLGVSDAKKHINKLLDEFKDKHLKLGTDGKCLKTIINDMAVFMGFAKQFRLITHQFQQNYGALNKYTLTLLLRQIRNEMDKIPSLSLLTTYTEIAFYIFSLDMHATASYRLCSIIDCLIKWAENIPDAMSKQELQNRIRREAKRVLDIYQTTSAYSNTNLEVMNLLITFNRLIDFDLPCEQIEKLFVLNKQDTDSYEHLNYFQICTLLYIIENKSEYKVIKEKIETEILKRLSSPSALKKAEAALLFLDIMPCPYVSKDKKLTVIEKCINCKREKAGNKYQQLASSKRWFFDWDKSHSLTNLLYKKEYHSPYE